MDIPRICKLARRFKGYTQVEFAEYFGVDATAVSRWEAGEFEPTPKRLRAILEIISHAEPATDLGYIQDSPTLKYVCRYDDFTMPVAVSAGLLRFIGRASMRDLMLGHPGDWLSADALRVNEIVQSDSRWADGAIAYFKTVHQDGRGRWLRTSGVPIPHRGMVLWEASPFDGNDPEFTIRLFAYSS